MLTGLALLVDNDIWIHHLPNIETIVFGGTRLFLDGRPALPTLRRTNQIITACSAKGNFFPQS